MSVTLYHTATEYTSNAISLLRGVISDITSVGVYHDTNPATIPAVAAFTLVYLADGTKKPPDPLAVAGEIDVVARIGPKIGADLALAAGVYQRWILVQTTSQDMIRAVDTVVIL